MRVQEMTWGWTVKGDNLGTPAESAVKASWPDYNAKYLQKKLSDEKRRYGPALGAHPLIDEVQQGVYLTEAIKGYEGEAEACLKAEFEQWLQGIHEENLLAEADDQRSYYRNDWANDDGGPRRRHVYDGEVSTEMRDNGQFGTGWRATRWGTKQLTNLEGVRDFLRAGKIAKDNAERDMNLLAERGPQDLNEAWMYFKHWVKRRPVSTCDEKGPPGYNSDALTVNGVDRINGTGPTLSLARSTGNPDNPGNPGTPTRMDSNASTVILDYADGQIPNPRWTNQAADDYADRPPTPLTDLEMAAATPLPYAFPPGLENYAVSRANSALDQAQQHINAAEFALNQKTVADLEMASAPPQPGPGGIRHPMSRSDITAQKADSQNPNRITQGVYPNPGFEVRQAAAEAAGNVTRDIKPNAFSMDSGGPSFGRTGMTDVYDSLEDIDV